MDARASVWCETWPITICICHRARSPVACRPHAPLFEPLGQALMDRLRSERHWHAHETRWAVFVDTEGRVGHRWYLWVFHARSVVHYVLDPARSAQVVTDELDSVKDAKDVRAVKKAILSCDRYSAYKKFARLHPGVVLAFCWAHQRRDFLELATRHPPCKAWALEWVGAIGQLYHLNAVRLQTLRDGDGDSDARGAAQAALHEAMQCLGDRREHALADPQLAAPARKVLHSMVAHWDGLTVFVHAPGCPWTTTPPSATCAGRSWDARISTARVPGGRANSPPRWTACSPRSGCGRLMRAPGWALTCRPAPTTPIGRRPISHPFFPGPWTRPGWWPCAQCRRVSVPLPMPVAKCSTLHEHELQAKTPARVTNRLTVADGQPTRHTAEICRIFTNEKNPITVSR